MRCNYTIWVKNIQDEFDNLYKRVIILIKNIKVCGILSIVKQTRLDSGRLKSLARATGLEPVTYGLTVPAIQRGVKFQFYRIFLRVLAN